MFFFMTNEAMRQREALKKMIEEGKANGLSLDELKQIIRRSGIQEINLSGHWEELREYLEITSEEYQNLGLMQWIN